MRTCISILAVSMVLTSPLNAQEYFGEFKDLPLKGEFVEAKPRPKFRLASDFRFLDPNGLMWSVPAKKEVDGASIPQAFWSFIGGPFEGVYINASVIHDHYCEVKTRTEHDTHRNFYYGMRAAGVEVWKAKLMYWAVSTFGPKWAVTKRVEQKLSCTPPDGAKFFCTQIPVVVTAVVPLPEVDLSDPHTLAAALSKASTVARTLRTTDGATLDISESGPVPGDLESISNSAERYRELFKSKSYIKTPKELGMLSDWNATGLEQVKPWDGNQLPAIVDAIPLESPGVDWSNRGRPFILTPKSIDRLQERMDLKTLEMRQFQLR